MSDQRDDELQHLWEHIAKVYLVIVASCSGLPIPIGLPIGVVTNLEMVPAVRRVVHIADDQPIPEQHQVNLSIGCTHWLAAVDLYGLLVGEEFDRVRVLGLLSNLTMAEEALRDLLNWLASQSEE